MASASRAPTATDARTRGAGRHERGAAVPAVADAGRRSRVARCGPRGAPDDGGHRVTGSFSTARRRALAARGFASTSVVDGRSGSPGQEADDRVARARGGRPVGHVAGLLGARPVGEALLHHAVLERVVREHEHRGPRARGGAPTRRARSARFGSSRLTSMRIAWKVRRAGWPPRRRAARGDAALHRLDQIAGRRERAAATISRGDAARVALLAVARDERRRGRPRSTRSRRSPRSASARCPCACRAAPRRPSTRTPAPDGRAAGC